MPTYIVLLGPPGVGKGTQAEILAANDSMTDAALRDQMAERFKPEGEPRPVEKRDRVMSICVIVNPLQG